jgi:hypothetical protein
MTKMMDSVYGVSISHNTELSENTRLTALHTPDFHTLGLPLPHYVEIIYHSCVTIYVKLLYKLLPRSDLINWFIFDYRCQIGTSSSMYAHLQSSLVYCTMVKIGDIVNIMCDIRVFSYYLTNGTNYILSITSSSLLYAMILSYVLQNPCLLALAIFSY